MTDTEKNPKSLAQLQVNPFVAVLVILLLGCFIAVYYWSTGRAAEFPGPGHMHISPQHELYVQVGNQLLQYDSRGEYKSRHDMAEIGIDFSMGDYAFFNNGDILLRIGEYDLSLSERMDSYQRKQQSDQELADKPGTGLSRCKLPQFECRPFGNIRVSFNRIYHLFIDPQTEQVYVADTSRHQLRKYNSEGSELAVSRSGYLFPNQMSWHDDKLYIANTNHHGIRVVKPDLQNSDSFIDQIDVNPRVAMKRAETWPSSLLRVGEQWWVINMMNDMSHGGIYIFDQHWRFLKRVALPEQADPVDMVVFGDQVLVSDYEYLRIYRISKEGEVVGLFTEPQLDNLLVQTASQRALYDRIADYTIAIFVVFVVAGFFIAFRQSARHSRINVANGNEVYCTDDIDINDAAIIWIEAREGLKRQFSTIMWLLAGLITLMLVTTGLTCSNTMSLVLALSVLLIFVPLMYMIYNMHRCRIGVLGDVLILQNSRGRFVAARGEYVYYSDMYIVIDNMAIALGSYTSGIFPKNELIAHVYPLLETGTELGARQMQSLLFSRKNSMVIYTMIYVLSLLALLITLTQYL